jgi:hypothetical protein
MSTNKKAAPKAARITKDFVMNVNDLDFCPRCRALEPTLISQAYQDACPTT